MEEKIKEMAKDLTPPQAQRFLIMLLKMDLGEYPLTQEDLFYLLTEA